MIPCPKCGHKNAVMSVSCSKCGTSLTAVEELETTMSLLLPGEAIDEERVLDLDRLIGGTPVLVIVKGRGMGDTYALEKSEMVIGRDIGSDIFLDDITVSRRHAVVSSVADEHVLEDAGSLNGTYVNRIRVEKAQLKDRDEIQVGRFRLVYLGKKVS